MAPRLVIANNATRCYDYTSLGELNRNHYRSDGVARLVWVIQHTSISMVWVIMRKMFLKLPDIFQKWLKHDYTHISSFSKKSENICAHTFFNGFYWFPNIHTSLGSGSFPRNLKSSQIVCNTTSTQDHPRSKGSPTPFWRCANVGEGNVETKKSPWDPNEKSLVFDPQSGLYRAYLGKTWAFSWITAKVVWWPNFMTLVRQL